jgi:hypothetical protein
MYVVFIHREEGVDFTLPGVPVLAGATASGQYPEGAVVQLGCLPTAGGARSVAWQIRCSAGRWKATFRQCDPSGNPMEDSSSAGRCTST